VVAVAELGALAGVLDEAVTRAKARPGAWIAWLPIQERFRKSQAKIRLLRAGNQSVGKTTVLLEDVLDHALGEHPYRPDGHENPGEYWIICASWSQSVAIQGKLAALLPPDRVHPDTVFNSTRGFKGKNPCVQVAHRTGGWSTIRFKTGSQDTLDLAGATIHGAAFDEVPKEPVFSEVLKRVQATGGWVSVGMTPIGAPVEYIRELVKAGLVEDIHERLTPEQLIPVGHTLPRRLPDGTLCDADWIAKIEAETPPHEVDVRVHGGWEIRLVDRYFAPFRSTGEGAHVHEHAPTGDVVLCLGVDHGSRPGKQIALLVAVEEGVLDEVSTSGVYRRHHRIYVVDEYVDVDGIADPEADADGILAMLEEHELEWSDLRHAYGDRVHMKGRGQQKSNKDLSAWLAKRLKTPMDAMRPQLRTVKRGEGRGAGSVSVGSRWLYNAMLRPGGFGVNPRCERLIKALDNYTMADDEFKDPVDALRYALDAYIFPRTAGPTPTVRVR
jgi:phage terminase large subunit-like protein